MAIKKIFVRMERTQTGSFGTHHAGVIYQVDDRTAETFEAYVKKGFAEEISAKDLARIVEEGGRVEAVADAEDGSTDDGANEGAGSADAGGEG